MWGTSSKTLARWRFLFRIPWKIQFLQDCYHTNLTSQKLNLFWAFFKGLCQRLRVSDCFYLRRKESFELWFHIKCLQSILHEITNSVWNRSDASNQCEIIWGSSFIKRICYDLAVKKMDGKTTLETLLSTVKMFLILLQPFEVNKTCWSGY